MGQQIEEGVAEMLNPAPAEFQPMSLPLATVYIVGSLMGNINKYEMKNVVIHRGKYAQYSKAIFVQGVPKGKRKPVGFVDTFQPSVLVLVGHGHPDPASMFGDYEQGSTPGVSVAQGRHRSFGKGWAEDFAALIDPYIAEHPGVVAADFRGQSAY